MVVVSSWRAFERGEASASVGGLVERGIGGVDHVAILGVHAHAGEVVAAAVDALLVIHAAPVLAGIVGAVQPAVVAVGLHQRVHAAGIARRNSDADAAESLCERGEPAGKRRPGIAAIGGLEQPAIRPGELAVLPRTLLRLPQYGINLARIARIERQVHRARAIVLVEDLLPARAAIGGPEDAALGVRAVRVAQHRDEDAVGVARVHQDGGDLLCVSQVQVPPALAAVGGFEDAVADRKVGPLQALPAAHVNDLGVGGRHRDAADRPGGLVVEDRPPGQAIVVGLPDSAVIHADVEDVRLTGNARRAHRAPGAERADHSPFEPGVERWIETLGGGREHQKSQ